MEEVRPQLAAVAAALIRFGTLEPEAEFSPLHDVALPPAVAAVDGSVRTLLDGGSFIVLALRAGHVAFRGHVPADDDAELEVLLITQENMAQLYDARYRAVVGAAPAEPLDDLAVAPERLREASEWAAAQRALDVLEPGALLLLDGALASPHRDGAAGLRALLAHAAAREVAVAAVAKRSSLAADGLPLVPALQRAGNRTTDEAWWTPLAAKSQGRAAVARLNAAVDWAFRIDVAGGDSLATAAALAHYARDAVYPGYPYPLAHAHNRVILDRDTGAGLTQALQGEALLAGLSPAAWEVLFSDYHTVLDRSV